MVVVVMKMMMVRCGNDGYSAVREMDGDPEEARRMIDSRLGALHSEVIVILPTLTTEMRKINPLLKVLAFHAKEVECNVKTLWSSFVTRTRCSTPLHCTYFNSFKPILKIEVFYKYNCLHNETRTSQLYSQKWASSGLTFVTNF